MERYKSIIPNWSDFISSLERPLPHTIRVNRLKITPESLKKRLEDKGYNVEVDSWCPYFFTVKGPESVGLLFEHWQGHYYVQEASSMIAPIALDPNPGELILDICAAPGGKTTHIAELMQNSGTIIANDIDSRRLKALGGNIYRLGILNTFVSNYNGLKMPKNVLFDRILLDVSCSAEGNARRLPRLRKGATLGYICRISGLQRALLLKMIDLLKPGGVIVYSTCTFAPEENEMVVQVALEDKDVKLEQIDISIPHCPGLTSWNEHKFCPDMEKCVRMYPHMIDSGGGFVAKMRKLSSEDEPDRKLQSELVETSKSLNSELIEYYEKRFGVDVSTFEGLKFIRKRDYVWTTAADIRMLEFFPKISSFGIRIAELMKEKSLRATDWGLVWLDGSVRKNRVNLPKEVLRSVLLSKGAKLAQEGEDGDVALCFSGEVIGSGLRKEKMVKCRMQSSHKNEIFRSLKAEGVMTNYELRVTKDELSSNY